MNQAVTHPRATERGAKRPAIGALPAFSMRKAKGRPELSALTFFERKYRARRECGSRNFRSSNLVSRGFRHHVEVADAREHVAVLR
ncbi:MAG TPA: hypothetical protein VIK97_13810, partial [Casimicrobiaceae bacterium]